ncbi:hypothetical protein ATE84_2893 [Aquimarina sp. MAR_2010_214]|uniref:hypothetical protein n=1 Tax=Aquimarina sp. MAR_2010_214 TaxID=1250026 RepID=UPI000C7021F4|nr:hypothetical protein [Aquimarina sp. MAR_2010_214]PKV50826.1 hypothetical protein ATE84_2893 [Aquimarina sp. MAR_2010_214]
MSIDNEVKQQASDLVVSWKEKNGDTRPESRTLDMKQNESMEAAFSQLENDSEKVPLTHEEIEAQRAKFLGTGEFNPASGKWEAQLDQFGTLELVTDDFDKTFEQMYSNQDRNENKDWQKYLEAAYADELERRKYKYDAMEAESMLTNEYYFLTKDGELEKDFNAYSVQFDENGEKQIRYTPLGYDRLPPDIKAEYEELHGSRENIVGKWVFNPDELIEKHDTFVHYTLNDEGYSTWEEYRDAKLGKQEKVTIENGQDIDTNDKPRETPSVLEEAENLIKR